MSRFEETITQALEALVATGERLSNGAEDKAFDVLEAAYRRIGAETKRETIPIFVSTTDAVVVSKTRRLETPAVEGNAMTHPLQAGAAGEFLLEAEGELLLLDDGLRQALLANPTENALKEKVAGKILLAAGLPALKLLRAAEAAGAAGVLFNTGERVRRMIVSDLWGSPASEADFDRYVKIPNAAITDEAAKSLMPGEVVRIENRVHSGWRPSTVLTAAVGCSPDIEETAASGKPCFLITGHMDSWGAGAVDNASGLAVSVGVLEALAALRTEQARRGETLKAGAIAVAWSGHSHGRYAGSAAWSERHSAALDRAAFLNVNADCLGMRDSVVTGHMPMMDCATPLARRALQGGAMKGELAPERFSRSCDQSFLSAGVPTVFSNVSEVPANKSGVSLAVAGLGGVYGPHWHTRCDDLCAVDPACFARDGGIILRAALIAAEEGVAALSLAEEAKVCAKRLKLALEEAQMALHEADAAQVFSVIPANDAQNCRAALKSFHDSAVWSGLERMLEKLEALQDEAIAPERRIQVLHALIRLGYAENELGFGRAGDKTKSRLEAALERFAVKVAALSKGTQDAAAAMSLLTAANGLHRAASLMQRRMASDLAEVL